MAQTSTQTVAQVLGRGPVHPFPARMAPEIALRLLRDHSKPMRVLDPMAGSGTVLAVARANGHRAFGRDMDPLAVLLSRVWTTPMDQDSFREAGRRVLADARDEFQELATADAYPLSADEETRRFARYWFDDYARRQLAVLSGRIRRVHDPIIRDGLWCAFSRLIITKTRGASLAMDLSHSRPHRAFERAPSKPFRAFERAVDIVAINTIGRGTRHRGPRTSCALGDARSLDVEARSVDLVITSPPYLNAIDYLRCSKFSLVWMGYQLNEIRKVRGESIGAEVGSESCGKNPWIERIASRAAEGETLPPRWLAILRRYVEDMDQVAAEVARVLRSDGKAVLVVGDSTASGVFVSNSEILSSVFARRGLVLSTKVSREIPDSRRYLPPPSTKRRGASIRSRMRKEVILHFRHS